MSQIINRVQANLGFGLVLKLNREVGSAEMSGQRGG